MNSYLSLCEEYVNNPDCRKFLTRSKEFKPVKKWLEENYPGYINERERIYAAAKKLTSPPKCSCGNKTKLYSIDVGFGTFCSTKCSWQSEATKKKVVETSLDKYGVSNYSKTPEARKRNAANTRAKSQIIQAKRREKMIENCGSVEKAYAEIWNRGRKTMVDKYGVANNSQIPLNSAVITRKNNYSKRLPDMLNELESLHGVTPTWNIAEYVGAGSEYSWKHSCGKVFDSYFNYAGIKPICPSCFPNPKSKQEEAVAGWLQEAGINFDRNTRKAIKPLELDFLIGNLGIEINGWWWHRDSLQRSSLLEKSKLAAEKGIRLMHFWDYEILEQPELCKSMIMNALGKSKRLYARKCSADFISRQDAKNFCNSNHISGFKGGLLFIGLKTPEQSLVGVMVVGKPRFSKIADFEIIRMCFAAGVSVVGGFSKMLNKFRSENGGSIISYSNSRFFDGASYQAVGFELISENSPGYHWIKGKIRISRNRAQKHKLKALLPDFDPSKSEKENMEEAGFHKVTDCGTKTWLLAAKSSEIGVLE